MRLDGDDNYFIASSCGSNITAVNEILSTLDGGWVQFVCFCQSVRPREGSTTGQSVAVYVCVCACVCVGFIGCRVVGYVPAS